MLQLSKQEPEEKFVFCAFCTTSGIKQNCLQVDPFQVFFQTMYPAIFHFFENGSEMPCVQSVSSQ